MSLARRPLVCFAQGLALLCRLRLTSTGMYYSLAFGDSSVGSSPFNAEIKVFIEYISINT